MPAFTATAPGKIILFGEHAVVYGQPAIAVPVNQVRARAVVTTNIRQSTEKGQQENYDQQGKAWVFIQAPDIDLTSPLPELPAGHPLREAILSVFSALGIVHPPACTVRVSSTIPQAAGLGSGAAITVAVIRALSAFLGHPFPPEQVSQLAFEVEKLHHGTPSGIDNSVITFNMPVYFVRGHPLQTLELSGSFRLLIGDTGVSSPTGLVVGDLRQRWQAHPTEYEEIFSSIGTISQKARIILESGNPEHLGGLMDQNQELLVRLGVSSPELDHLVDAARQAGALGAKLSGGGRGGNMIALVGEETAHNVAHKLLKAGATRIIDTLVGKTVRR